jgi:cytidine deaminase
VTTDDELISAAAALLRPYWAGDRLFGDVASALVTADGNRYGGVCVDTASGTGFCAEAGAVAAMVTAGEYRIGRIVAVWRNDEGALHVLPPCGRCREFIRQIHPTNLDTAVILGRHRVLLRDLLPAHQWPEPLERS